jgi:hypothetical protein
MKKILLAAVFTVSAEALEPDWLDVCGQFAEISGGIMQARQDGIEMKKIITAINQTDGSQSQLDMARDMTKITIAAYEIPRYQTEEKQQSVVTEFKNEVFLKCTKQITDASKT